MSTVILRPGDSMATLPGGSPAFADLSELALRLGAARDLPGVYRTLREFVERLAPMNGMFVSRYDPDAKLRTCVYAFSEGDELDVATFPAMPNTGSPHSQCVETGETIVTQDFQEAMAGKPRVNVALDKDPRLPQSSVVVAMKAHDTILGGMEIQSSQPRAFTADHVATLQLAANLAALAVDNVNAVERERKVRAELEARAMHLEARAQERVGELAAKNRELEAFSFTAAHDLRAPLRGILNLSGSLLEREGQTLSERGRLDLAAVVASSEKMARLVEDLLRFARTSQGSVKRELVDMTAIARQILAEREADEPDRKAHVEVQPNLYVEADPALLRILLDNLLGNAWKYTRAKPATTIRVGAELAQGEIVYFVQDNGVGFTADQAKRIFLAFERLQPNEYEGTGVGLATAQRVVQRHGGRIWADGRPGEGAAFRFTLQPKRT
ncbi:MAG TPA: ATP-binding protein [Candidatus Thermoplasmatota archaeon]|nr:ATP-binding protein [Candidatus Thermoplasmatota archaeon]